MDFAMFREILGFLVGILYLWWEYKADPKVWIASVIMPMISMWIYYSKGLYADFAINIYYLIIAVYGFITWTGKSLRGNGGVKNNSSEKEKRAVPITHTPIPVWIGASLVALILWGGIWWMLVTFTDSTVPVADAFTTALSIVGLWMLARKYVEQWLVWLIVDIVCCGLYFYKGLMFYSILYGIYSVIAVIGYRNWLKMMHMQEKL